MPGQALAGRLGRQTQLIVERITIGWPLLW